MQRTGVGNKFFHILSQFQYLSVSPEKLVHVYLMRVFNKAKLGISA